MGTLVMVIGSMAFLGAVAMTVWGVILLIPRKAAASVSGPVSNAVTPPTPSVALEGKGTIALEPGVLLNTLWEHLPNAECQSGECGGCMARLLEGQVRWIREPIVTLDRKTHVLCCSCEPLGPVTLSLDLKS